MSKWRDEINRKALARLDKALPEVFPPPVLTHAMGRRFTPPMPRLAIDSYWRAHPVRADRLARALAAKSGAPAGWTWRLANEKPDRGRRKTENEKPDWLMWSFRVPPAPYRERPLCAWARLLLHLRPASLPVRLACGLMWSWREPECRLARRLRSRLGLMDGAERSCARS